MHKLRRVKGSPSGYLAEIIDCKSGDRGDRLEALKSRLANRYAVLEAAYTVADLGGVAVSTWTPAARSDLLHCYESTVKSLETLKSLIKQRQPEGLRDLCPYCGIGPAVQFDHYLPKARYPEFSVHSYNLVPCCGPCNGLKSETWLEAGVRVFLNIYIDSLPTAPMLKPSVTWSIRGGRSVPKVSYALVRPAHFRAGKFRIIEKHFEKLELLDRYKDQSHSEFTILRDAALAREANTVATLRRFLLQFLERRKETLGPLNWKVALYEELITHRPFLGECLAT